MENFTSTQLANNVGTVVDRALTAPVMITRHGRDCVIVISVPAYEALVAAARAARIPQEGTDHD